MARASVQTQILQRATRQPTYSLNIIKVFSACVALAPISLWAQMVIAPTPEYRREALAALTEHEKKLLAHSIPFRIEAKNAVMELPRSAKRSTANLFKISWVEFFAESNQEAGERGRVLQVEIVRTKTLTRTFVDTGHDSPSFTLEIEWRSPLGHLVTVYSEAFGPTYIAHGDVRTQPESVRSSNIGFYIAYLQAIAKIVEQNEPTVERAEK